MRQLWQHHYDDVAAYDRAKWSGNNRTRFYGYFLRSGSDMQLHTLAVKRGKDGKAHVKDVVIMSVNCGEMHIRDLGYGAMCGYIVDWSKEGLGHGYYWVYDDWSQEQYSTRSNLWKIRCPIVNPDELVAHERFKYCGWSIGIGTHPIDYLKAYVDHPRIELLSKAGLGWMATKSGFIKALEKDKQLLKFVMDNVKACRCAGIDGIRLAYKRGIPVEHGQVIVDNRKKFRGLGMPDEVSKDKAHAYITERYIPVENYVAHLHRCMAIGLDLNDTKVSYPRYFKARYKEVEEKHAAMVAMKEMAERAQFNKDIKSAAEEAAAIERVKSKRFKAVLPRKVDDFISVGEQMGNCLGDGHYTTRVARRESLIVFIRKTGSKGKAYVAVEYNIKDRRIVQCYGRNNSKPAVDVRKFVTNIFERTKVKAALELMRKGA